MGLVACSTQPPAPVTNAKKVLRASKAKAPTVITTKKPEVKAVKKEAKRVEKTPIKVEQPPTAKDLQSKWLWPVEGKVSRKFSTEKGYKGINIAGELGQPVIAAADGKVVYSGSGLAGYGKLLIVKHVDDYLTAYANNDVLLVKEGDTVKKGDSIAKMGIGEQQQAYCYFEMRYKGKPIDPLRHLAARTE